MANLKFSGFTAAAAIDQTDSFLVGFDTDGGGANPTNNKWTFPEVAAGLAAVTATPFSIYAADGTIGTTRKALITDTLQFRNAGDTKDVFKLNTTGAFALGLDAANTSETNVCIGIEATTPSVYGVAIGRKTSIGGTASYATVIGNEASTTSAQSVVVGAYSTVGFKGTTLGYSAGSTANYAINIGYGAEGSGASSITLNANSGSATPSTVNAFGVYMTSSATPDFEVVGSGTSTLRTNLNVTGNMEVDGQAWGDLYDGGTIADAGTYTPDWNNGNVQKITIVSGGGITIANGTNVNNGATYILIIEQAGTGGTVTWAGKYRFPAGTAPTLTSGAGKADVITMIPYNATSVLCSSTLDFLTT